MKILHLASLALAAILAVAPAAAAPTSGHDGISCRQCHDGGTGGAAHDPAVLARCTACHAGALAAEAAAPAFHGRGRCLDCHRFHAADKVVTPAVGDLDLGGWRASTGPIASAATTARATWPTCPRPTGPPDASTTRTWPCSRGRAPSSPCLWCHSRTAAPPVGKRRPPRTRIAFSEHASHPFAVAVQPGRGAPVRRMRDVIDPRIPLPGGRIECVSCHRLTATTKDRLHLPGHPQGPLPGLPPAPGVGRRGHGADGPPRRPLTDDFIALLEKWKSVEFQSDIRFCFWLSTYLLRMD